MKEKKENETCVSLEKTFFIVKDYFQENGRNSKAIIEEYIIREASDLP